MILASHNTIHIHTAPKPQPQEAASAEEAAAAAVAAEVSSQRRSEEGPAGFSSSPTTTMASSGAATVAQWHHRRLESSSSSSNLRKSRSRVDVTVAPPPPPPAPADGKEGGGGAGAGAGAGEGASGGIPLLNAPLEQWPVPSEEEDDCDLEEPVKHLVRCIALRQFPLLVLPAACVLHKRQLPDVGLPHLPSYIIYDRCWWCTGSARR